MSYLEVEELPLLRDFFETYFSKWTKGTSSGPGLSITQNNSMRNSRGSVKENVKLSDGECIDNQVLQHREMVAFHDMHYRFNFLKGNSKRDPSSRPFVQKMKLQGFLVFVCPFVFPACLVTLLIWCVTEAFRNGAISYSLWHNHERNTSGDYDLDYNYGSVLSLDYAIRLFSLICMGSLIALSKSPSRSDDHVFEEVSSNRIFRAVLATLVATLLSSLLNSFDALVRLKSNVGSLSLLLVSCCLLFTFPYFSFFFSLLHPQKVISTIARKKLDKLEALLAPFQNEGKNTKECRRKSLKNLAIFVPQGIDALFDMCCSSVRTKDKAGAFSSIKFMNWFIRVYENRKHELPHEWHSLFQKESCIAESSEFSSLTPKFLDAVEKQHIWVEWKLLRKYQLVFEKSMIGMSEVGFDISMSTRRLAQTSLLHMDLNVYNLCVRFLNSFIRSAITCKHVSLLFNLVYQYRLLGEFVIWSHASNRLKLQHETVDEYVCDLGRYLRHYSLLCVESGLPFIAYIISHDLSTLCYLAHCKRLKCHGRLLDMLISFGNHETIKSCRNGVRRHQLHLATKYMLLNEHGHAKKIWQATTADPSHDLRRVSSSISTAVKWF